MSPLDPTKLSLALGTEYAHRDPQTGTDSKKKILGEHRKKREGETHKMRKEGTEF